ncbi:Cellulose synthase-like protein G2 [Vitis vinifera]|uniref:Cellulose synthase-like protein G2 n=1 Tax=Vitis vinifera TaxID=29760 RepID=A0A438E5W9_VITVI|nr:Cellulose synthase-like protein G2 [Vitis vinifera]
MGSRMKLYLRRDAPIMCTVELSLCPTISKLVHVLASPLMALTDQSQGLPLHTRALLHRTSANRVFAVLYLCAILALLYHHYLALLNSTTIVSFLILLADAVLAFMWVTAQAFRMCPTQRQVFIEHLQHMHVAEESDYPALDVFICTADPYKEPPIGVVNTALSVMAYDYPVEKLSVYVSDDGGSQLTLFAFMEAARVQALIRLPEADQIKLMYENMRVRVETVVKSGIISHDYINSKQELEAFSRWTDGFTSQNHPAVIQREKHQVTHNFKAGALNALLRVSATMTNAPVILPLDSDMYSNDPQTPLRALCYILDPSMDPKLAYVQFPQIFYGINKNDIYGGEARHGMLIHPAGMDGLKGPMYLGRALGMDHWLRTSTLAICFNVRDGSPFLPSYKACVSGKFTHQFA